MFAQGELRRLINKTEAAAEDVVKHVDAYREAHERLRVDLETGRIPAPRPDAPAPAPTKIRLITGAT